ncbi:hypothetical protein Bca4012_025390 [Brassica carinata]
MAEDLSINISPFNGGHRNSDAIQKNTLFRHLIPTMATSYNSPCRFERKPVAALTLQRLWFTGSTWICKGQKSGWRLNIDFFRNLHQSGDSKQTPLTTVNQDSIQRFSKNAKHEMLLANHLSSLWLVANALERYVSTGGFETTKEFVAKMEMKLGQKFRYVGCGIEGGYFYMAEAFDVHVVGIDLLVNMISFALERAIGLTCSPQRHILITLSTSFTAVTLFSTSKTSQLFLHSSSGLNQVEEFSSLTTARVLKLRLQYS